MSGAGSPSCRPGLVLIGLRQGDEEVNKRIKQKVYIKLVSYFSQEPGTRKESVEPTEIHLTRQRKHKQEQNGGQKGFRSERSFGIKVIRCFVSHLPCT